jgi:coenzyme F420-reducing hydrogenase alpha subunit
MDRTVRIEALTRVEGEGALHLELEGDRVRAARLDIYEPPRFFEALLRGRDYTEPVDITARICGICPVAYQMSACLALEDACGVTVPADIDALRRAMYCGEWIESHVLHLAMLQGPDLLGYAGGIEMAADHRPVVEAALRLKQLGNRLVELVGGRAIHPINVRLGGFYRAPSPEAVSSFLPELDEALELAVTVAQWAAGLTYPDAHLDTELLALVEPDRYGMMGGRLRSDRGLDIVPHEFATHVVEEQHANSTALYARLRERGAYVVGPMARYALNGDLLRPVARSLAEGFGHLPADRNPHRTLITRALEVVHACEEAREVLGGYHLPTAPAVPVPARAGVGHGWTEAPRGMLYHRYEIAADGSVVGATITPPTAQNQAAIEAALVELANERLRAGGSDAELAGACERLIRTFDPCISCATHFLDLRIVRGSSVRG